MTQNMPKGPLWSSPERVAKDIVKAVARGRGEIYTPWFWRYIMWIIRGLPDRVFHKTRL
jgi:short-subunit dehydrogenase